MVTPNRTSAIHIGIFDAEFSNLRDFFQPKYSTKSESVLGAKVNALRFE
jgi:hypothetical protein